MKVGLSTHHPYLGFKLRVGVGEALKLLKESEVLKIEDILPIIPHFTVIDDIKDEICHSLEEYNNAIEQLKVEMNDYTKTAENIRKEIEEQDKKFQVTVVNTMTILIGMTVECIDHNGNANVQPLWAPCHRQTDLLRLSLLSCFSCGLPFERS